jgi:hypothetical protein
MCHVQLQANTILVLSHPQKQGQNGLLGNRKELQKNAGRVIRLKRHCSYINTSISQYDLSGHWMDFNQGVGRQSQGRRHTLGVIGPSIKEYDRILATVT